MYTEEVPIYANLSITQRRYDSVYRRCTYIYPSINYTDEVRKSIQKRYLYIPISQLHRGGKIMYTEEIPLHTNLSITQRREDSVYRRGTYIYQSINYTEEIRQCIKNRYLYTPIIQLHRGGNTRYTEEVDIYQSINYTE